MNKFGFHFSTFLSTDGLNCVLLQMYIPKPSPSNVVPLGDKVMLNNKKR